MFFLKKLVSYFILPPGLFVILLLLIALVSGKNRLVRRLALASALGLYLISTEPVKDALIYPLEFEHPRADPETAQAIVVLGGGVYNSGYLKSSSYKRLITGFLLHRDTGLPIILSGGAAINAIPEARIMKKLLEEFGVEDGNIYADLQSRDTRENALRVREICDRIGCRRVLIVTSAFHMGRALESFRKVGLEPLPYPTDFRFEGRYNLYSLFPKIGALYDSSVAIREHIGRVFYRIAY
jgi:uncharacterized SAM-binding protein YcdF (DUF218 family)